MATTKKMKKGTASKSGKKRLTKAELDRQKAIKRMPVSYTHLTLPTTPYV